jgi:hypothetical protein
MISKTRRAYSETRLEFSHRIHINPGIKDPKKLRKHASNLRKAARLELEYAQTALNEASSELGRSHKVRIGNRELAEELLWDSKEALHWYRARLRRAEVYRSAADKLIKKARRNK